MKFIRNVLTPPVFDDEIKTQRAYLLYIVLWTLVCVPIPYVIYTLIKVPENTERALIQSTFGEMINILLLIMTRRGFVKVAAIIQVSAFWIFLTATAFTGNGVHDEAYLLGYVLVIAIAGILLGGIGASTFTILSLAAGIFMVYEQSLGNISSRFTSSPLTTWVISLVLFPVGAILQHLASHDTRLALSRARASEEKYRLISEVSSDYTFSTVVDTEGNMHLNWVAGAFKEITGYTYAEYVDKGGWFAHLHPEDVERDHKALVALQKNQTTTSEVRTFMKEHEIRWVRVYAHPVWDGGQNQLKGIVGAVQDITEQKAAEERESNRRVLLEKVLELGKRVTEANDLHTTLERIWHGVHDDLDFDRLAVFLYNAERNSMESMIGTDVNGNQQDTSGYWFPISEWSTFKIVLEKPDGLYLTHNYDVENNIPEGHEMHGVKDYAAVAAWAGDKPVAVITVDRRITGRRITELQLEALRLFAGYVGLAIQNSLLNVALQTELTHRQTLIDELETKNAELERFTYTVSHDLKSPLVTITGFLGFLEKDALAGNAARIKSSINRITKAAEKMQSLLNDLLELSRIGRLMNPPEDVPFEEIVYEAVDHVRGRLDKINAIVEIQRDLPKVRGDRARLVEVVQNLVDNAAKYADVNKNTRIEIGTDGATENDCSIFFVRDNGIGIDPKFHERVFGLFNKLDVQSEGTGVGLSLVKRIIEVHNGRIWVESEVGKSTTFYFSLPMPQVKE